MDIISVKQFKKRLVDLFVRSRQESLPKKPQDRHILLNSVVMDMEVDREYTEREVNAVIQGWTMMVGCDMRVDVFSIRRELVDRGYIEAELGITPVDVEIMIFESSACNFGFRGMTGDEAQSDYKVNV